MNPDMWQNISTFLTVRDLCTLMSVSRGYYDLWISDRMWMYQKLRVCARFPELESIFGFEKNDRKRVRTQNVIHKGIWYTFKYWLMYASSLKGFIDIQRNKHLRPLVFSIVTILIPFNIIKKKITKDNVFIWTSIGRIKIEISCTWGFNSLEGNGIYYSNYTPDCQRAWKLFLLDIPFDSFWVHEGSLLV